MLENMSKYISSSERDALPDEDFAGPDRSFPVKQGTVKAAWDLAGHASDPEGVRSKIKDIAKRKGLEGEMPQDAQAEAKRDAATPVAESKKDIGEVVYVEYSLDISKSTKNADGVLIEGYASTRDKDRQGDVVSPQAFAKHLDTYMKNPVLLFNHKKDVTIGKTLSAHIDDYGLYVRALVTEPDYAAKISRGELRAFSWVGRAKLHVDAVTKTRHISEAELHEISVVTIPAGAKALFNVAKSLDELFVKNEENEMNEEIAAVLKAVTVKLEAMQVKLDGYETAKTAEVTAEVTTRKAIVEPGTARHDVALQKDGPISEELVIKAMSEGHASQVVERFCKEYEKLTDEERRVIGSMTRKALIHGMAE